MNPSIQEFSQIRKSFCADLTLIFLSNSLIFTKRVQQLLIFIILGQVLIWPTVGFAQNPKVGGGEDYGSWVDEPKDKNQIITNARQLIERLSMAQPGHIVYIDDNIEINLDGYSNIEIKTGVILASGRGRNGSLGGKLFRTKKVKDEVFGLFHVTGDYVRITGLRIEGPDKDKKGNSDEINNAISVNSPVAITRKNILIDNNEIFGWQKSGIEVRNIKGVIIRHNHIHHCLYRKVGVTSRGYGITVSDAAEAKISNNLFDHNRHDVASDGHPLSEYHFYSNLILNGGISHSLDVHGWHETRCKWWKSNCNIEKRQDGSYYAGQRFSFEKNIILASEKPDIFIRGNTEEVIIIKNNQFSKKCWRSIKHSKNGASGLKGGGTRCKNVPSFIEIEDNIFKAKLPSAFFVSYLGESSWTFRMFTGFNQLIVGDFGGDKRQDLFTSINRRWFISGNGNKEFLEINSSNESFDDLRFGDFNGDGITDVFAKFNKKWWASYSATGTWQQLNSSKVKLKKLLFGDFNGDKKADVLGTFDGKWHFSWGGTSQWEKLNTSSIKASKLQVGDFNGDGIDDIFNARGGKWYVSWGGRSQWEKLNTSSIKASKLQVGDFNGDGIDDIFNTRSGKWYVSWGGKSQWKKINESDYSLGKLIFGDYNGDGKTDIGVIDSFW